MKMNINTPQENTEITIPNTWDEMTQEQALTIYAILMRNTGDILEPHEVLATKRILLFQALAKVDDRFLEAWRKDCFDTYGELDGKASFLSELKQVSEEATKFLFEAELNDQGEPTGNYSIALKLTKNFFPKISYTRDKKKKGKKKQEKIFYGPSDGLENLTIYELGQSFTYFESYLQDIKNGDEFAANKTIDFLIAMLWRDGKPKNTNNKLSAYQGDRRRPYLNHEDAVEFRVKKIQHLPEQIKQLIMFWFASCRQQIINSYPNVFQPSTGGKIGGNQYGWGGTLLALANKDLSKLDQVSQQNHHNALTLLSLLEDERKTTALQSL